MTESAQRISDGLKAAHPEVEWRRIRAFRNVLVHEYLGIDLEHIWEIIQPDVPEFKRAISVLLGQKP